MKGLISLGVAVAALAAAGCATHTPVLPPVGQASFGDYQRDVREWLQQERRFQTEAQGDELGWNAPAEWRPAGTPTQGVLLLHGLGDSPWSFTDLGRTLAAQGYLVRTALLPGHGTQPAHLLGVDLDDWRRVVREQVALLRKDVDQVVLGGFSTGANLALEYTLDHPDDVSGLLLFSPAFKADAPGGWVLPWLARVKPWLRAPDDARAQQTMVRYLNVPTNAFAQFHRSSTALRSKLDGARIDKPALLVLAQHDSVVDVTFVRRAFAEHFTHPASRLVWYGDDPRRATEPRTLVRADRLPEERISQFSHMGVLFSPLNPHYGREGKQRYCWNGQDEAGQKSCETGAVVWYSDWGHTEAGKVHARLTFNPYFDWQSTVMEEVLREIRPASR